MIVWFNDNILQIWNTWRFYISNEIQQSKLFWFKSYATRVLMGWIISIYIHFSLDNLQKIRNQYQLNICRKSQLREVRSDTVKSLDVDCLKKISIKCNFRWKHFFYCGFGDKDATVMKMQTLADFLISYFALHFQFKILVKFWMKIKVVWYFYCGNLNYNFVNDGMIQW